MRSRYWRAASMGSTFSAHRPGTPGIAVGVEERFVPSTSSRFDAGSVLTSSTRLPASASAIAVALAVEVLPTPPFPVKKRMRVGRSISGGMGLTSAAQQQHFDFLGVESDAFEPQQPPAPLKLDVGAGRPVHSASCSRVG